MLIGLAFLLGYGLASFEKTGEIQQNNELLSNVALKSAAIANIINSYETGYTTCLTQFQDESLPSDNLLTFMDDCTKQMKEQNAQIVQSIQDDLYSDTGLTFNWSTCDDNQGSTYEWDQATLFTENWFSSQQQWMEKLIGEGMSESDAYTQSLSKADGSQNDCVVNYVGGAIYWFTIMTTIGYGNCAVTTVGGRMLVFFCGFFSILVFSALIGHAGYIMLTIVDDFFNRVGLKTLTKGITAVVFWFVMLLLWLFVVAGIFKLWIQVNYGEMAKYIDFDWFDAYWFAYITVTTVGFGDYNIPHDTARARDMFMVPIIILIGFVLLANFILKLSQFITMQADANADDEIEVQPEPPRAFYDLSGGNDIKGRTVDVRDDMNSQKHDVSVLDEDISFTRSEMQVDDEISYETGK